MRRKSLTELYHYLLEYYGVSETEAVKGQMAYTELYSEWIEYKKKYIGVSNTKKSLSPSTIRRYERDFDNFFKGTELSKMAISEISPIDLESCVRDVIVRHKLPEKSASNLLGYISQSFAYAYKAGYIHADPAARVGRKLLLAMCEYVPPKADEDRVLTIQELCNLRKAVLEHEKRHPGYIPDYGIELSIMSGMRVGEISALKWESIDDEYIHVDFAERRMDYADRASEIVIGPPKRHKPRLIPLTDEMMELLERIKELGHPSSDGFVFTYPDGHRCESHNISCAVVRRASEAGVKRTSIHGIRRTVSSILRTKLPVTAVANLMGHLEQTNEEHYNYDFSQDKEKRDALREMSSNILFFDMDREVKKTKTEVCRQVR